ncbi:hypothetical protein GW17_00015971 [Ensete ventricosum]|nr:hypothetical protein GW17_00015971 [Ensete ventricosum]RZS08764.1 hypothetical protein BHM03_00039786 [Ensete ventricosum]
MLAVDEGIKCRSDGLQLWQRLEMVALGRVRRGVESAVANVEGSPMVGEATEVVIALKEGMTTWVVSRRWGLKGRWYYHRTELRNMGSSSISTSLSSTATTRAVPPLAIGVTITESLENWLWVVPPLRPDSTIT